MSTFELTPKLDTDQEVSLSQRHDVDIEELADTDAQLQNHTVINISWRNVSVTIRDRASKMSKILVDNVEGMVYAGELLALMGPSGSGKTTLLNVLAQRPAAAEYIDGSILINGRKISTQAFRDITCYVEQDDAQIGALTVRETLEFASRLSCTGLLTAKARILRIDSLLDALGISDQAETIIGTHTRKGISSGQKRRVGIAAQLITSPKIIFLDEPTSGLDSTASFEVVKYLKGIAKRNHLIIIASIHQPSTNTFNLFDKLLLLSAGKTYYFGPVSDVTDHFGGLGFQVPLHMNPAEFIIEHVNADFFQNSEVATRALYVRQLAWAGSVRSQEISLSVVQAESQGSHGQDIETEYAAKGPGTASLVLVLLHRQFIKSHRDVVAYGIRLLMYIGLAIMMGTVWLRLEARQELIISLTNAIFFGGAFMSFMAVAYIPAFLEDYTNYVKEKQNGLYGALEFSIANFLIGLPYLFFIALIFSLISYWLSNFQPTAEAFMVWFMWLFLDLLAAESLVIVVASIFPSFVIALSLVAFANGLWMCVNGFMVYPDDLNVFYKYVFHYWDYQKYVFEGMIVNEFKDRVYDCETSSDGGCHCMFQTKLEDQCKISGYGVLESYNFHPDNFGRNIGLMLAIIAGYRIIGYLILIIKTR